MTKFLACLLVLSQMSFAFADVKPAGTVLVYRDFGSCKENCSEAAAAVPISMGYTVRYVGRDDINDSLFADAILWIQPGGNAIKVAKYLGKNRLAMIRDFVRRGGNYVGFCAGAFLADSTVDDDNLIAGLGIIPVSTYDAPFDSHNDWGTMVWVDWLGQRRQLFFNGGAGFSVSEKDMTVTVLARFEQNGDPATIQTRYGNGNVVVTGAHPEALDGWKEDAEKADAQANHQPPNIIVVPRDSTLDLARDMVRRALGLEPSY